MKSRTVACRLSLKEWEAFQALCKKHHTTYQDLFRSIIIDALYEEGWDALRCEQPKRREGSTEASEACGATTP
jgi:hypothetical protein